MMSWEGHVTYFEVLFVNLPEGHEEYYEKLYTIMQ
jgi:hypothetical protein